MRAVTLSLFLMLFSFGCGLDSGGAGAGGVGGGSGGTGAIGGLGGSGAVGASGGSGGSAGAAGTGGFSGAGGTACESLANKLIGCGLATGGIVGGCTEPSDAVEVCESNCLFNASCADVDALFCGGGTGAIVTCSDQCGNQPDFLCGDGESFPANFRCDGFADCTNGFDESGCPPDTFFCSDGSTVPLDFQCDGGLDCSDGSDEINCLEVNCN